MVVGAVLLHQHQSRGGLRRGETQVKESTINGKGASSPRRRPPNLLELQLLKPPRANGQPAWSSGHKAGEGILKLLPFKASLAHRTSRTFLIAYYSVLATMEHQIKGIFFHP